MTTAGTPIATLDQAKAWLADLIAGSSTEVGADLFVPAIVRQVFAVLPGFSPITLTGIAVNETTATLTGLATVLDEPLCTVTFAFSDDEDDPLLLTLTVARPRSYRWQPVPSISGLALGNLVAKVTPVPAVAPVAAVTLEFDCTLFAGTSAQFDAALTLPAFPGGDWRLVVAETTPQPFSAELLTVMTGDDTSGSVLPTSGFPLDQFKLNDFEITFSPTAGTCSGLTLGLEFDPDPPWKPFGDRFEISAFKLDFAGYFRPIVDFQAVATAKTIIGPAQVDVSVQFPDQAITVYLDEHTSLSVSEAFTAFGIRLPEKFPDIQISTLSLGLYVSAQRVDFILGIDQPFKISESVELDKFLFNLGISYQGGITGHGDLFAIFSIPVEAQTVTLELAGAYDSSGALSLSAKARDIPAGDLIAALLKKFNIDSSVIPTPIRELEITLLELDFTRAVGADTTDTFRFFCDATTVINGASAEIIPDISIVYNETTKSWAATFTGTLILERPNDAGTLTFSVEFSKLPEDTWFQATFVAAPVKGHPGDIQPLGFADIAGVFGFDLSGITIPEGLDLDLVGVTFRYDSNGAGGRSSLFFGAASTNINYGKVSYISIGAATAPRAFDAPVGAALPAARQHVFILAANRMLSMSDLPLVGTDLASIGQVALDHIQAAIAFPAPVDAATAITLNAQIDAADPDRLYPRIPAAGLPERILLATDLEISGAAPRPVSIPLGGSDNGTAPGAELVVEAASDPSGAAQWFDVQKSFGPVSIQKVGVRYADGMVWGLLSASLETGVVQVGLIGLGLGSPLESFAPQFTVDGVTISVNAGPMAFSGALVGRIQPVDLYGELGLSLPEFSLGALGAYADFEGHPSCFLYAVLDAELGGPPFFFITGLAAGFALNRSLVIPPVGSLGTFPLIAWATGSGPSSSSGGDTASNVEHAMQQLVDSGVVAPSIGEYWLAAGIKFSSFQLIESFALLTIKFGKEFEIDLLGLSSLSLPPDDTTDAIALAELALEVSFSPAHGLIAVSGQLTPRSFLLSRTCHITGGFAFYMWYAGDHAGDFVLSLGGYNPHFHKPDHYPDVPRLGLNWQVCDNLSISGDEYFALTASAVMAGGGLRAVWSSGAVSAWFAVEADFLLLFRPLHYYISASIELGASVAIDLWFTSFTLSVHLGVVGEIYGPPFGGRIHVDLYIVSFTIAFGNDEVLPTPIEWHEFVTTMLPRRTPATGPSSLLAQSADLADTEPAPVLQISGVAGILKTLPAVSGVEFPLDWLVDGDTFALALASTIPIVDAQLAATGNTTVGFDASDHRVWEKQLAVAPSAIAAGDLTSTLTVTVGSDEDVTFVATRTIGPVPRAIWDLRPADPHGVPEVDPLNDTVIPDAFTGLAVTPQAPAAPHSLPIPIEYLSFTNDGGRIPLGWSDPTIFTVDPFADQTVDNTIARPIPTANRAAIIAAVNRAGFAVDTTVDVSALTNSQSGSLLAPPVLRYLVESR